MPVMKCVCLFPLIETQQYSSAKSTLPASNSMPPSMWCHLCNRLGHSKSECPHYGSTTCAHPIPQQMPASLSGPKPSSEVPSWSKAKQGHFSLVNDFQGGSCQAPQPHSLSLCNSSTPALLPGELLVQPTPEDMLRMEDFATCPVDPTDKGVSSYYTLLWDGEPVLEKNVSGDSSILQNPQLLSTAIPPPCGYKSGSQTDHCTQ